MERGLLSLDVGDGLVVAVASLATASVFPQAVIEVRAGIEVRAIPEETGIAILVRLSPGGLRTLLGDSPLAEPLLRRVAEGDGIRLPVTNAALVRRVVEEIHSGAYSGTPLRLFLQGKAIELLVEALSEPEATASPSVAEAARDILLANPLSPPPMADIAARLGVSQRALGQNFKAVFGRTAQEWLAEWRLARGYDLVLYSAVPMAEIAASLGYAHLPTFTGAFTKRFGAPPTRLRSGGTVIPRS